MKKIVLILTIASLIVSSCCEKEENFISKVVKKTAETNSISYNFTQKYYYSNGKDTVTTPCEAWIVRDTKDSLRNGYIWVNNKYRPYNMIYDKGNFYLAIPPKKVTTLYTNYTESFISEIDWIDTFLKPDNFQKQYLDTLNSSTISDTIYKGEACKKIVIQFPKGKKKEQKSNTYIFNEKELTPRLISTKTVNKNSTYFEEISFDNFQFNTVNLDKLHQQQEKVIAENPIEKRSENSEFSILKSMLHVGEKAPLFEGKYYTNSEKFELSKYIGENVIIVDFWYTHCPPCVKAFPALIELYDQNKNAGLKIFGVNSVDNQPRSLKNLDNFLSKRKMNYDIVMIQPQVDLNYKIKQYPSIYVIDKSGEIAYVELGYDKEKFEKLKAKVAELLQE